MAEMEELNDESKRLCDIRPTGAVLIITQLKSDSIDHSINIQIGHLIGKRLQEFDSLNSSEINDFRFKMRRLGDEIIKERSNKKWEDRLFYQFPPRLASYKEFKEPFKIISKFEQSYCDSENRANDKEVLHSSFSFNVLPTMRPIELLENILGKRATLLKRHERSSEFVLKVCGQDEYLVGDYPLIKFQYIQDCLSRNVTPTLVTVHKDHVPSKIITIICRLVVFLFIINGISE